MVSNVKRAETFLLYKSVIKIFEKISENSYLKLYEIDLKPHDSFSILYFNLKILTKAIFF